ncbi:cysteine proteinase inhibitor [Striga asiatica]|uniref:Cysteine proteinase inhibitor n=1 Tax=Striga asiatica TaxID=4170 RepID=A0A5A7RCW7_STRAF|nr:cysteine proteinase inhibitor [Striga asiatica]
MAVNDAYHEYMDDVNNSEGFYVTPTRDGSVIFGSIRPMLGKFSGDEVHRKAEAAARHAVEEHNRKSLGSLEFLKIVNFNVEPTAGAMYYMTVAAGEDSGEARLYEVKVWEKINSGFRVEIFRPAPYSMKSSDKLGSNVCCVEVNNLTMPWMGEAYLYYKCFYRYKSKIIGVEVNDDEESGKNKGIVWFKNGEEKEDFVNTYTGKSMPRTDGTYSFDS